MSCSLKPLGVLEDMARYAGLLLAPADGLGLRPRAFFALGLKNWNWKIENCSGTKIILWFNWKLLMNIVKFEYRRRKNKGQWFNYSWHCTKENSHLKTSIGQWKTNIGQRKNQHWTMENKHWVIENHQYQYWRIYCELCSRLFIIFHPNYFIMVFLYVEDVWNF